MTRRRGRGWVTHPPHYYKPAGVSLSPSDDPCEVCQLPRSNAQHIKPGEQAPARKARPKTVPEEDPTKRRYGDDS